MRLIIRFVFLFIISGSVTFGRQENVFTRLHEDLFEDRSYNADTIPMVKPAGEDNTNAINLAVGITVISMDVTPGGVLFANTWLRTFWTDYRLKWDPSDYGGLKSIRVPPSQVWKPDLSIFNAANFGSGSFEDRFSSSHTLAIIYSNGDVLWMPPLPMEVNCHHNDMLETAGGHHQCNIRIGSWTYDGNHLNLTNFGGLDALDLSDMSNTSAYVVTDQEGESLTTSYYGCCGAPYLAMDYRFTVNRADRGAVGEGRGVRETFGTEHTEEDNKIIETDEAENTEEEKNISETDDSDSHEDDEMVLETEVTQVPFDGALFPTGWGGICTTCE